LKLCAGEWRKKPKCGFFEGAEGIKSINAEIKKDLENLKTPYQFYVVFSADRMEAVLPGWIDNNSHIYFEPFMKKFAIISDTPLLQKFLDKSKDQKKHVPPDMAQGPKEFRPIRFAGKTKSLTWI